MPRVDDVVSEQNFDIWRFAHPERPVDVIEYRCLVRDWGTIWSPKVAWDRRK